MPKKTLTASTPVGTFTRTTDADYKFICVWASPRAKSAFDRANAGDERVLRCSGVQARWVKDHGHIVSWHSKLPSKIGQCWDLGATLLGVFEI